MADHALHVRLLILYDSLEQDLRFATGESPLEFTTQYVARTEEIATCPSQNYATSRAHATCQVHQHAQMALRMGTRVARTVADHALHVRLLIFNDN